MDWDLLVKLAAAFVGLASIAIKQVMERRPRLVAYVSHASGFVGHGLKADDSAAAALPAPRKPSSEGGAEAETTSETSEAPPAPAALPAWGNYQGQPPIIHSHTVVIRNIGKSTAFNVRIGHNLKPKSYEISPRVYHQAVDVPGGGWEVWIPTLVPNEAVQIAYLYPSSANWWHINTYTKSDQGAAEVLDAMQGIPTAPASWVRRWTRLTLIAIGVATLAYGAFVAALWVVGVTRALNG
jgi:hypothetical protein